MNPYIDKCGKCVDCGAPILSISKRCRSCAGTNNSKSFKRQIIEELKYLIALYQTERARELVGSDYADKRIEEWHGQASQDQ